MVYQTTQTQKVSLLDDHLFFLYLKVEPYEIASIQLYLSFIAIPYGLT